MISIIICSRLKDISEELAQNISNTIGSLYELILIDNSESKYSIFEAYNIGIKKSKGNLLCFIHDDILFHTRDWGVILELEFKTNPNFDLIGIAGSKVKTQFPTGWWDCEDKCKVINIIQHDKEKIETQYFGFLSDNLQEVLVVDGVFMALKKNNDYLFDDDLRGYHNYDLNLSSSVKAGGRKIGVTQKILIEHFSIGKLNKDWLLSTIIFHKKYYKNLRKNNSTPVQEIFGGKKYIDNCMRILGKKQGLMYLFFVFKFSTSIKVNFILAKHIFNKFFR